MSISVLKTDGDSSPRTIISREPNPSAPRLLDRLRLALETRRNRRETIGEVGPAIGHDGQVEVVRVALETVYADGEAAHDDAGEDDRLKCSDNGRQPFFGVQST